MLDFLAQHADLVFMAGSVGFIIALIPMVRAKEKPPARASVQTASILSCFSLTYVALGLPFAAVTSAVTAVMWWCLAAQALGQQTGREIAHESRAQFREELKRLHREQHGYDVEFTGAEQAVADEYSRGGW